MKSDKKPTHKEQFPLLRDLKVVEDLHRKELHAHRGGSSLWHEWSNDLKWTGKGVWHATNHSEG